VLYAPAEGIVKHYCAICDVVEAGQLLAEVGGLEVKAKIAGVVRGLIREGIRVKKGIKIADIDPRMDSKSCYKISDKAIIIGCSVLEAMKSIEKEFVG
jgi:xanthine dehydrogenase accessory factor